MRLTLILFYIFFFAGAALAATLPVGKGKQYATIKSAIEAASTGDTVMIFEGLYKEGNITIEKKIHIIGIGKPVLDGEKKYEIMSIKKSGVTVEGLVIIRSSESTLDEPCGIKIYDADSVVIKNNFFDDNYFAIYLQSSSRSLIKGNYIKAYGKDESGIGNGIHAWKCDSLQIIGNEIYGQRDGIYFEFVTHSIVWLNYAEKNVRYGLHFMFSNNDTYISNTFVNNGAGVAVMFTNKVTMIGNRFLNNWGESSYGLLLKEISDCYILNNTFKHNSTAIFLEGANRFLLEGNQIESNGWGMKIQANCMDNVIRKNNFIGNTFDMSTNGTLVLNTFEQNYWDKYEGYDLNRDQIGDVPFRPLSLYSVIVDNNPPAMILFRSFIVALLDKAEKVMPSLTPENFIDNSPLIKPLPFVSL